jgi:hypothetical protein
MTRRRASDLVVFVGPSLPADEVRALAPCRVLAPARAGDLFAVLPERPLAVALIDGVFESVPSVWHHEILAAQAAGVQVFGGASMGALRAVELERHGMVGVGRVFAWYRDGAVDDDGEVALLHADATFGYRPFTVPLVDVRGAVAFAVTRGMASRAEGRAVLEAAAALFYQARTWPAVLSASRLSPTARARLGPLLASAPSVKAADARATVEAAAVFARARAAGAPPPARPELPPPSSHARRLRLEAALSQRRGQAPQPGRAVLAALEARPDAARLAAQGLRRAVLAAQARSLGLRPSQAEVDEAERAWCRELGVPPGRGEARRAALGLDAGAERALLEDLALESAMLQAARVALPDGPSWLEGLALGARLTGAWEAELAELGGARRGRPRGGAPAAARRGRRASRAAVRRGSARSGGPRR